jgi:hypothetical protein
MKIPKLCWFNPTFSWWNLPVWLANVAYGAGNSAIYRWMSLSNPIYRTIDLLKIPIESNGFFPFKSLIKIDHSSIILPFTPSLWSRSPRPQHRRWRMRWRHWTWLRWRSDRSGWSGAVGCWGVSVWDEDLLSSWIQPGILWMFRPCFGVRNGSSKVM